MTDKAIKDGFQNLKPGKDYENLYQSAVARSEADWYIGLNATRALTTKFNAQLNWQCCPDTCRRHHRQTRRGNQKFQPKTYYGIEAQTDTKLKLDLAG